MIKIEWAKILTEGLRIDPITKEFFIGNQNSTLLTNHNGSCTERKNILELSDLFE